MVMICYLYFEKCKLFTTFRDLFDTVDTFCIVLKLEKVHCHCKEKKRWQKKEKVTYSYLRKVSAVSKSVGNHTQDLTMLQNILQNYQHSSKFRHTKRLLYENNIC